MTLQLLCNHRELIGVLKARLVRRELDNLKILIKINVKFNLKNQIIYRIHNRHKMKIKII